MTISPGCVVTVISYDPGRPDDPVARAMAAVWKLTFVIVCTPSDTEKERGLTEPNGMFRARGLANVIITVTKSLVV